MIKFAPDKYSNCFLGHATCAAQRCSFVSFFAASVTCQSRISINVTFAERHISISLCSGVKHNTAARFLLTSARFIAL